MATNLADLVDLLKNALAPAGTFDTEYPEAGEPDLLLSLANGFSQAQLHGFFPANELDLDTYDLLEPIDNPGGALVVIYTKAAFLRSRLLSMNSHVKYVAGAVSYEADKAASVLKTLLDEANEEIKDLRDEARRSGAGAAFYMADRYVAQMGGSRYFD